ncbi:hypothetical protein, partial [uncultured Halomonas sp.]|uniref:hypothetical protein n=1 Tax=uncultured Halomonas sp. TaxID=173971 RepID=UPI002622A167
LISVELESLGISVSERGEVHGVIRQLVDPQSPNFLSDEGLAKLNQYASGGFEIISDEVGEPPRALPLFLMKLHKIVGGGWE